MPAPGKLRMRLSASLITQCNCAHGGKYMPFASIFIAIFKLFWYSKQENKRLGTYGLK